MDRARGRRRRRLVWAAVLAVGVPLAVGLVTSLLTPEWKWNDWGALVVSICLSIVFFGLAVFVDRGSDRRAQAVANAELITSMGSLDMSAARSFAGHDHQALRIAADARAALQQFALADEQRKRALLASIEDSYSNLAFGTFARADALARAVWDTLSDGALDVVQEALVLADAAGTGDIDQADQLRQMAAHVAFVRRVGESVRASSSLSSPSKIENPLNQELAGLWPAARAVRPDDALVAPLEPTRQLELLYRKELTVWKDWSVLNAAGAGPLTVTVSATLFEDLRPLCAWLAPWYVAWDGKRRAYRPVNYECRALDEAAAADELASDSRFPIYPHPLRHGNVPRGMRDRRIDNLHRLIVSQHSTTVCVLTYKLDELDEKVVVLDGNHRLAAALRVYDEALADRRRKSRAQAVSPVRVLAFTISERRPVDTPVSNLPAFPGAEWRGFTPDVGLIRGTWLPAHLIAPRPRHQPSPDLRDHLWWAITKPWRARHGRRR